MCLRPCFSFFIRLSTTEKSHIGSALKRASLLLHCSFLWSLAKRGDVSLAISCWRFRWAEFYTIASFLKQTIQRGTQGWRNSVSLGWLGMGAADSGWGRLLSLGAGKMAVRWGLRRQERGLRQLWILVGFSGPFFRSLDVLPTGSVLFLDSPHYPWPCFLSPPYLHPCPALYLSSWYPLPHDFVSPRGSSGYSLCSQLWLFNPNFWK